MFQEFPGLMAEVILTHIIGPWFPEGHFANNHLFWVSGEIGLLGCCMCTYLNIQIIYIVRIPAQNIYTKPPQNLSATL